MPRNSQTFPAPDQRHPILSPDGTVYEGTVFLAAAVDHPRLTVGAYTYASSFDPPKDWAARLAPYLFDFSPESLSIGRFCQIADGVTFITASANHRHDGISTFPFAIFGGGSPEGRPSMPEPGRDTIIGNDVWIGQGARILPGAVLEDGVIVGAGSVVAGRVPAYSIVAGNPAKIVRSRFADGDVAQLIKLAWWDWPIKTILAHEARICAGDVAALMRAAGSIDP